MSIGFILLLVLITIIIYQADKISNQKNRLEKEDKRSDDLRTTFRELEKDLFEEIDLEGWSFISKSHRIEKPNTTPHQHLQLKAYRLGKTVGDISFTMYFDPDKNCWRSESIIPREDTGSLNFYLAESDTLQKCIYISNGQIEKTDFEAQKNLLQRRDRLIDKLEELVSVHGGNFNSDSDTRPQKKMMEIIIDTDEKIYKAHKTGDDLNEGKIINEFKNYLGGQ